MRLINTRCIVQSKGGSDKYYPKVLMVDTSESFPWSVPLARIKINTHLIGGTAGYMSPIRNDDIVRLQINIRAEESEISVWQDIFEGRVMEISSEYGLNNTTTLVCRGHSEEFLYKAVTAAYGTSSGRTGAMLATLVGLYLDRLTDDSLIDTTASTVIPNYNIDQDTKFMRDVISEFESLEAYGYIFKVVTNYLTNGDLDTNIVSWQPVPSTENTIKIIQGTPRLISAQFSKTIENVVEDVKIYGAPGTPQKSGVSVDGSPSYGTRHHRGVDTSIATNQLCEDLSIATRSRFGAGIIKGSVTILGDPGISIGDLIYVKIPSLVIDGSHIEGTYRVKRLSHMIDNAGWKTYLELGDLIESPADILAGVHTKNRLTAANFIG